MSKVIAKGEFSSPERNSPGNFQMEFDYIVLVVLEATGIVTYKTYLTTNMRENDNIQLGISIAPILLQDYSDQLALVTAVHRAFKKCVNKLVQFKTYSK